MTNRDLLIKFAFVTACLLAAISFSLKAQPFQEQEPVKPHFEKDRPNSLVDVLQNAAIHLVPNDIKDSSTLSTNAPLTAQAQGGLIWFTNQAEFEASNLCDGLVLSGIEDFEESILDPNTLDGLDDPLEEGEPNLPDGFPFPAGLTGLPGLIVQSNLGGGNPIVLNPRGLNGLAALSDGALGAISDIIVASDFDDSIDLIFTNFTGSVGFNPLSFIGSKAVNIRVYNTNNQFLGEMTSPADPSGTNFVGVLSPESIGRINIFDPDGSEGADNIQAWTGYIACADGNCDGTVDAFDIEVFFFVLIDPESYTGCNIKNLDINGDCLVNNFDIEPFSEILFNQGGCQ